MVRINEAMQNDSAAMKTVAVLTLTFLPATFVSVLKFSPPCQPRQQLTAMQAVFGTAFFKFLAWERSSSRSLGRFGENLDILGNLTSTYNRHDFVLVHVAEEFQKDVIGFGFLLTANRGGRVG